MPTGTFCKPVCGCICRCVQERIHSRCASGADSRLWCRFPGDTAPIRHSSRLWPDQPSRRHAGCGLRHLPLHQAGCVISAGLSRWLQWTWSWAVSCMYDVTRLYCIVEQSDDRKLEDLRHVALKDVNAASQKCLSEKLFTPAHSLHPRAHLYKHTFTEVPSVTATNHVTEPSCACMAGAYGRGIPYSATTPMAASAGRPQYQPSAAVAPYTATGVVTPAPATGFAATGAGHRMTSCGAGIGGGGGRVALSCSSDLY